MASMKGQFSWMGVILLAYQLFQIKSRKDKRISYTFSPNSPSWSFWNDFTHDVIRPMSKSKHLLYKYSKVIFKYKCLGQSIINLNQEIWVLVQNSTIPALVKVIMFLVMTAIFSDSGSLRVGYYSSYFLSMILAVIRTHPNWSNTAMKKDRIKFWQGVFSLKHASDTLYIEDLPGLIDSGHFP